MKRRLFAELTEGFDALKAERGWKTTLRRHTVESKHAAIKSIKAGLKEAIAHQRAKASGVKMHSVSHEPWLIERLKNPTIAAAYLESAIEDGNQGGIVLALRHVANRACCCRLGRLRASRKGADETFHLPRQTNPRPQGRRLCGDVP